MEEENWENVGEVYFFSPLLNALQRWCVYNDMCGVCAVCEYNMDTYYYDDTTGKLNGSDINILLCFDLFELLISLFIMKIRKCDSISSLLCDLNNIFVLPSWLRMDLG